MHLDRNRTENLVLFPAVGQNALLDDVFDDELGLSARVNEVNESFLRQRDNTHADCFPIGSLLPRLHDCTIRTFARLAFDDKVIDPPQAGHSRIRPRIDRSERMRVVQFDGTRGRHDAASCSRFKRVTVHFRC